MTDAWRKLPTQASLPQHSGGTGTQLTPERGSQCARAANWSRTLTPPASGSPSFTNTSGKTGPLEHPAFRTRSGCSTRVRYSCQRTSGSPAAPRQECRTGTPTATLVHERKEFVAGGDGEEGEDGGGLLLGVIGAAHQGA